MSIIYTAHASATNGREGRAKSNDGKIDLLLSPPGSGGAGTNPEQLFAAGYSACFGQALKAISAKEDIKPDSVTVDAAVHLHKEEDGFHLSVELSADLPGITQEEAEKLVTLAHQMCPYSKATRGNVEVSLSVNGNALKKAA